MHFPDHGVELRSLLACHRIAKRRSFWGIQIVLGTRGTIALPNDEAEPRLNSDEPSGGEHSWSGRTALGAVSSLRQLPTQPADSFTNAPTPLI